MSSVKTATREWRSVRLASLAVLLCLLLVCRPVVQEDLSGNGASIGTCTPCSNSSCSDPNNCPQECIGECPNNFYQAMLNSSFVCVPPLITTMVVTTTTTTPTTLETTIEEATTEEGTTSGTATNPVNDSTVHRRRRQAQDNMTDETTVFESTVAEQTIVESTSTVATTTVATTTVAKTTVAKTTKPTPTTESPKIICNPCSISYCKLCKDDSQDNKICGDCNDGYHLSSDMKSCIKDDDDKLSAGAIAGIVIGSVCFVALVVVAAVCLVRRYRGKINLHGNQAKKNKSRPKIEEDPELRDLGPAPAPPRNDSTKRYDSLQTRNNEEVPSYAALQNSNDETYVNLNSAGVQHNQSHYVNNTHADKPPEASKSNKQNKLGSSNTFNESTEFYEPVNARPVAEDPQEVYENRDSIIEAQQRSNRLVENQEIYYNDIQDREEEVYEN